MTPFRISIQAFIGLQFPQRHICPDPKLRLCLIHLIQTKCAQIDGRSHRPVSHFLPEHSGQNKIVFFLIQSICLVKALCPYILIIIKHGFLSIFLLIVISEHQKFIHCFPMKLLLLHKVHDGFFF